MNLRSIKEETNDVGIEQGWRQNCKISISIARGVLPQENHLEAANLAWSLKDSLCQRPNLGSEVSTEAYTGALKTRDVVEGRRA